MSRLASTGSADGSRYQSGQLVRLVPRVRVKDRCCGDRTLCRKCPLLWGRLSRAGLADRVAKRQYEPTVSLTSVALKAARRRSAPAGVHTDQRTKERRLPHV
jgi:hypothetical protein